MKYLLLRIAVAVLAVFLPIRATIVTVMVLTVLDLISGLVAARRRKETITSSGLKRTVVKTFVYELAVILGFLVDKYLTGGIVPVINIVGGFIGITELKSILENLEEITGLSLVKLLIDKLSQAQDQLPPPSDTP